MLSSCAFCGCKLLLQKVSMRARFWKILRNYRRCGDGSCFTLIPKLTSKELDELYSDYYLEDGGNLVDSADDDSNNWVRKFKETIRFLRTQELDSKTFHDFGSGVDGRGIKVAKKVGLAVSGLEVSEGTWTILNEATNCTIYSPARLRLSPEFIDYILLSDMLERAPEPSLILEQATQHLSEGGVLLIQGPLECARSFTNLLLRIYSFLTPSMVSHFFPYHVSLANQLSMKVQLNANELKIEKMRSPETWWPAPRAIPSLKTLPKVMPQIVTKLLDFTASFLLPSYGSGFCPVTSKGIQ